MVDYLVKFSLKIFLFIAGIDGLIKDHRSREIIRLYEKDGFTSLFAKIRFWDAPYREIAKVVPREGTIVDLGCGDGLLVNYLALGYPERRLVGIEINEERAKYANKGLGNTQFIIGDVLSQTSPRADAILMVHLLHHLPSKDAQFKLIKMAVARIRAGGKIIIAEVCEKPLGKYIFGWLTDAFIVPILFERKLFDFSFHYRKSWEWKEILRGFGLRVKTTFPHKGMPFSHVLFECSKIKK